MIMEKLDKIISIACKHSKIIQNLDYWENEFLDANTFQYSSDYQRYLKNMIYYDNLNNEMLNKINKLFNYILTNSEVIEKIFNRFKNIHQYSSKYNIMISVRKEYRKQIYNKNIMKIIKRGSINSDIALFILDGQNDIFEIIENNL